MWTISPVQVQCMRQGAQGWCTGKTWGMDWGGRWEGSSGWGTHVHPWLIHVNVWQKPLQYCKVISLQFKKKKRTHLLKEAEKAMAPHSSTLAWKIPWMEEPGGLQSMGLLRVRHNWVTSLSCIGEGNGNPLQCSCLENPRGGGAWWAAIYGVAQSRTRLKWLSSSSSS